MKRPTPGRPAPAPMLRGSIRVIVLNLAAHVDKED